MKTKYLISIFGGITIFLSGCNLLPQTYPTGTWKSDDEKLVVNFSEKGFGENAGTIELEQGIFPIYWLISDIERLSIYKSSALHDDSIMDDSEYYFEGYLRYKNGTFTIKVIASQISQYPEDMLVTLVPCNGAGTTPNLGDLPSPVDLKASEGLSNSPSPVKPTRLSPTPI